MGKLIPFFLFDKSDTDGLLKPIIYCNPTEDISEIAISIENELVDSLLAIKPKYRSKNIAKCFASILAKLPTNAVICDIDVLFNPSYEINVLKMLIEACKQRNFSIIWPSTGIFIPGTEETAKLVYAADGYADYKEYPIADYDITCII